MSTHPAVQLGRAGCTTASAESLARRVKVVSDLQTSDAADLRRRTIVCAGFDQIAVAGFEGLRMREVAARAGVNIATVHYYVNSKDLLIREVAVLAVERLQAALPNSGDAEDRLRAYLRGIASIALKDSALLHVLGEVRLRADRDQEVAAVLAQVDREWHEKLETMISELPNGLRSRTRPAEAAALMMMTLAGACLPPVEATRVAAATNQLERWLLGS